MHSDAARRFTAYPLAILFAVIMLALPGYLSNPQRNIRAAARSATLNPQGVHQTFSSNLRIISHRGYVMVLHTGDQSEFSPAIFLTITKLDSKLTLDMINGPGIENLSQLSGDDAAEYLKKHQIDLKVFDTLITKKVVY